MRFPPTNVVSFSKLDHRLSFKKTHLQRYACSVEQEPIKVVQLIFAQDRTFDSPHLKMKHFDFLKFHNWSICFCSTNVVSFSKLDHRLSFKETRLQKYACSVEQEPIKVVQLIFAHPVY